QVEGVCLDPFDLPSVETGVLIGDFQRRARAVHAGDVRAFGREVKRESALIAEDVKALPMGIAGGGRVVLPLVEERASLLSGEGVELKLDAIHLEDRVCLFSPA